MHGGDVPCRLDRVSFLFGQDRLLRDWTNFQPMTDRLKRVFHVKRVLAFR